MPHPGELKSQLLWTAFILMFFCIQAVIWTVAISVTSRDSSHAVVAGYDEQALRWDEVKATEKRSAKLGWKSEICVDSATDLRGNHCLTVQIKDQLGNPVSDADLNLRAFHRAAAGEPQIIRLKEARPGVYTSMIQINRFGYWNFSGIAKLRGKSYLIKETVSVVEDKG